MRTVGVSDFVKQQLKKGGKSELINISLEEVADYAQIKLNNNDFKQGYRDGVVIIESKDESFYKKFKCPLTKITDDSRLVCNVTKRRPEEDSYIQI